MNDRALAPPDLAQILGHTFAREELLQEALTHTSILQIRRGPRRSSARRGLERRGYERLEFLGDRVLGLIVADLLWRRFPREDEGKLSLRHTHLVRSEALAEAAQAFGLSAFIIVAPGEEAAGVRDNPSVLADVCEAVIAALYLDGGLEVATRFVERWWEPRLAASSLPSNDPKNALQEWAQGRGLPLPTYRTVSTEGPPHRRCFTVTVTVQGLAPATATGMSKRAAESAAAAGALSALVEAQ
jgi:ribonuclease-3